MNGNTATHEAFLEKLEKIHGSTYIPLEKYVKCGVKLKIRCSKCGGNWRTTPTSLLSGYGCHTCARAERLTKLKPRTTPAEFKAEIKQTNPDIRLLGSFTGIKEPIDVKCRLCDREWSMTADALRQGKGCLPCRSTRITEDAFKVRLKKKRPHMRLVSSFTEMTAPAVFKCLTCNTKEERIAQAVMYSKYGCNTCAKREGHSKTGYRRTTHNIDGHKFKLQGYEHLALRWLIDNKDLDITQVMHGKDVPTIPYRYGKEKRTYFPDFLCGHYVIEVKSDYTLLGTKKWFDIIVAKRAATVAAGYKFMLLCFDKNEGKCKLPKQWWKLDHATLRRQIC